MRVRVTYDKIERRFRKTVKCAGDCGHYITRQKTFMQTSESVQRTRAD